MQPMDSQELDRRINAFLTKKHQKYPELGLRPRVHDEPKASGPTWIFKEFMTGLKWELGL